MNTVLRRTLAFAGFPGVAAVILIAVSLCLTELAKPLQERARLLDSELESKRQPTPSLMAKHGRASSDLGAFYRFFDRREITTDWLAKLYAISLSTGVGLRTAEYSVAESQRRLRRYQVSLPVSGTYAQIRAFIEVSLGDIPVLALDQVRIRRTRDTSQRVEADVVFSLYELRQ